MRARDKPCAMCGVYDDLHDKPEPAVLWNHPRVCSISCAMCMCMVCVPRDGDGRHSHIGYNGGGGGGRLATPKVKVQGGWRSGEGEAHAAACCVKTEGSAHSTQHT